jgi:metal-sulfur cluster biosynthetic enzyme
MTEDLRAGRTAADLAEQAVSPAEPAAGAGPAPAGGPAKVEDIEEAMRDVVDPELGINVVDLGLVYDIRVEEDNTATLDMTLTSAACPLTDVIEDQTASVLIGSAGIVQDFRINWVWMPPWGPEKITEDGREQLRALGFTV